MKESCGFDWTSKGGIQIYVLHVLDDATRFHLGQRIYCVMHQHPSKQSKICGFNGQDHHKKFCMTRVESSSPSHGRTFLQAHCIQPVLSAAPWQRGRIERHGGVVKEMLARMDHEQNFTNLAEIDEALNQCFRAKNSMIVSNGYSPEQAVAR